MNLYNSIKLFIHPRVMTMLFLGFSAGVPILLIFSTLGLWLNEAGVVKSTITFFLGQHSVTLLNSYGRHWLIDYLYQLLLGH